MGRFAAQDIKGFTPGIDATQSQDLFVLGGENYLFDSLGPRSAFGNRRLSPFKMNKPQNAQGFRIKLRTGSRCFTFDNDGIWEWDEAAGWYKLLTRINDTTFSPYRWTYGFLDNKVFMAHPVGGFYVYDLNSNLCVPHSAASNVDLGPVIAIAVNNGRLCAITDIMFYWSAASDGLDYEPKTGGAGFQMISDRVAGSPIMLTSYSSGCLTWTTEGVLRSEFTGDAVVYRHRSINVDYRPVNSFCLNRVDDDSVVIVDERGLFLAQRDSIKPFAPLFNEFLIKYFEANKMDSLNNIRLEYDAPHRLFYLSVSSSYDDPMYESAFVYYPSVDKWGQFNEAHYGIIPITIGFSSRADSYFGFVDSEGYTRYWSRTASREYNPKFALSHFEADLFRPVIQRTQYFADDVSGRIMPSSLKLDTVRSQPSGRVAGYYIGNSVATVLPELAPLNASIRIGFIRALSDASADQLAEIQSLIVRSLASQTTAPNPTDFNFTPPPVAGQDWNQTQAAVDYGYEPTNYVNHKLTLISTLDGSTAFNKCEPTLVRFEKAAHYYTCTSSGIWHILELKADAVGESFHLYTLELSAVNAGRLI